jgi:hypothetical protein
MGDDRIDTVISHIISLISHIDIQDDHIDMVDDHIDNHYPISIDHIPYRQLYRCCIDVRSPISISHIDLPIISCHPGGRATATAAARRGGGGSGGCGGRGEGVAKGAAAVHGAGLGGIRVLRGRAVQFDPIKPTLKASGTKRLKLAHDEVL